MREHAGAGHRQTETHFEAASVYCSMERTADTIVDVGAFRTVSPCAQS